MIPRRLFLLAAVAGLRLVAAEEAGVSCSGKARVWRHVFLPSAERRHGELRLVSVGDCQRPGCACACVRVETVLFSRMLARGLLRIRQEESRAWPEGSAHHADSRRYLEALDAARDEILGPSAETPDLDQPVQAGSPLRTLLITFARDARGARITLAAATLSGTDGDGPVTIESTRVIRDVNVDPAYALANFRTMLARGFNVGDNETGPWLNEALAHAGLTKS